MDEHPAASDNKRMNGNKERAVVLVSGGMDSAVVLALARERGLDCYALSVSYGQRHGAELAAAAELSASEGAIEHKTVVVDLRSIGGSALTADIDVPESASTGIPVTYVPARNTIMLSVALGWAERSEERRVGKECVQPCISRWSPYH